METIPLPLVNGALWVDNSFLEDLQACPRLCQYRDCERRVPSFDKPALNFGGGTHRWLKYRYRFAPEGPNDRDNQVMSKIIFGHFKVHPNPADDHRQPNLAVMLMERYNKLFQIEPWKVVQTSKGAFVEFPFAFKLFDYPCATLAIRKPDWPVDRIVSYETIKMSVYYTGRIDLAVEMEGSIYVVDHKTTSQLGPSFFEDQSMSAQQRGYCWAFHKATGVLPKGYLINAIRVRRPSKTERGKKPVEDDDFERQRFYLDESTLEEWERNVIALVEEFLWHHGRNYMPMKTKWCVGKYGRCAYFDVCSLPLPNRAEMLKSNLFEDNKWSPLNH